MDVSNIGLTDAAEYVIIAAFVATMTQNIKQTKLPNAALPYVAWVIGIVGGLIAVKLTGESNYLGGAVAGLLTAAATSGGVDAVKAAAAGVKSAVSKKQPEQTTTQQPKE